MVVEWDGGRWTRPSPRHTTRHSTARRDGGAYLPIGTPGAGRPSLRVDWLGRTGATASYPWLCRSRLEQPHIRAVGARDSVRAMRRRRAAHDASGKPPTTTGKAPIRAPVWRTRTCRGGGDRIRRSGRERIPGILALLFAGVGRGFITRAQVSNRPNEDCEASWSGPTGTTARVVVYVNGATGPTTAVRHARRPAATYVETAFLMQGLLTARRALQGHGPRRAARSHDPHLRASGNPASSGTGTSADATRSNKPSSTGALVAEVGTPDPSTRWSASTKCMSTIYLLAISVADLHLASPASTYYSWVGERGAERPDRIAKDGRGARTETATANMRQEAISGIPLDVLASGRARAAVSSRTTPASASIRTCCTTNSPLVVLPEFPQHGADQPRVLHRRPGSTSSATARTRGAHRERRPVGVRAACAGRRARRGTIRADWSATRPSRTPLRNHWWRSKHYYRDLRCRAVGHLRAARRVQSGRKLGVADLHGTQPGADRGDGGELSHGDCTVAGDSPRPIPRCRSMLQKPDRRQSMKRTNRQMKLSWRLGHSVLAEVPPAA